MAEPMKVCAACKEVKTVAEYHKQESRSDGLHPWCKPCALAYNRKRLDRPEVHAKHLAWRRTNERYERGSRVRYLYGVDLDDLLARQGGKCAVCSTSEPGGRWGTWHVDHDRECCPPPRQRTCGECVRGLLCANCNLMLGHAKDAPDLLRAAAEYVERHAAGTKRGKTNV